MMPDGSQSFSADIPAATAGRTKTTAATMVNRLITSSRSLLPVVLLTCSPSPCGQGNRSHTSETASIRQLDQPSRRAGPHHEQSIMNLSINDTAPARTTKECITGEQDNTDQADRRTGPAPHWRPGLVRDRRLGREMPVWRHFPAQTVIDHPVPRA